MDKLTLAMLDFKHMKDMTHRHPAAARPVEPGIVCDRHDEPAGLNGEQRAAHAVAARLTCGHARALRKDHDPVALVEPLLALLDDLGHGGVSRRAIDGDRVHLA